MGARVRLPAPKLELFELLRSRRSSTHREDRIYQRLASLMVDLTLFVPDADLADLEAARASCCLEARSRVGG